MVILFHFILSRILFLCMIQNIFKYFYQLKHIYVFNPAQFTQQHLLFPNSFPPYLF